MRRCNIPEPEKCGGLVFREDTCRRQHGHAGLHWSANRAWGQRDIQSWPRQRLSQRPAPENDKPTALSTSPDGEQKGADKAQERGVVNSKPVTHVYVSRPNHFGGTTHTTLCGRMADPSRTANTSPTVNCKLCLKKSQPPAESAARTTRGKEEGQC
jgi:hypothetical protein